MRTPAQVHHFSPALDDSQSMRLTKKIEKTSQDVFLIAHPDNRTVTLADGQHAGHHFFQCLAKLHRNQFVREHNQDTRIRNVPVAMVASLCNNGRGGIFVKGASNSEWTPILNYLDAADFIFRALLSFYNAEEIPMNANPNVKKRALEEDLEAAESLLLVRTSSGDSGCRSGAAVENGLSPELRPKKRVRFASNVVFDSKNASRKRHPVSHRRAKSKHSIQNSKGRVSPSTVILTNEGIPYSSITDNDILCGSSGEGILTTTNLGNLRFLAIIDASVGERFKARTDKRKLSAMAKLAVKAVYELIPRGRFLVRHPSTSLWYQVRPEVAISMTLHSFKVQINRSASQQCSTAVQLLLEGQIRKQKRSKVFNSLSAQCTSLTSANCN